MRKTSPGLAAILALFLATSASAQGIKWHPGHYVMLPGGGSVSTNLKCIDEIGRVSAIKGVEVRIWWYDLEPSKGVYDFSMIDKYLARLKAQPTAKRLVVRIMDRKFNTGSKSGIIPNYLRTKYYDWGLVETHSGYAAKLWEKPVMDRLITLYKVMGKRYDRDSHFEGIASEESTLSLPTPYPWNYSDAALEKQYERLISYAQPAMPHTNVFLDVNWLGKTSVMQRLVASMMPLPAAAGGSNVMPNKLTLAQKVVTGYYGADYRGHLAVASSVEFRELMDYTPKQIGDFAYNTLKLNYIFWERNTWAGGCSSRWDTGILPYLKTNPHYRSGCPSSYGTCDW